MNDVNNFGERLKQALKNAGYTQARATEELKLSKNAMTNYVKGRIPDATILYNLSNLLGLSMEWLLTGKETKQQENNDGIADNNVNEKLTDDEIRLIKLFRQLNDKEKIKIEGMLEMKIYELKESKKGRSSTFQSGEDAENKKKKHA